MDSKSNKNPIIPVTLLSGFLGAGKTTLLKNILENNQNMKFALIVNDMATLNIDAALIEKTGLLQEKEEIIKLQNGCICCTLRGDLLKGVKSLAETGEYDYIIIESSGIAEPQQVAETFVLDVETANLPDGPGFVLSDYARLDTCVTVVDLADFDSQLSSVLSIAEAHGESKGELEGEKPLSQLLIDQLEFANVIILNKVDLVSPEQSLAVEKVVKKLNPNAKIIRSAFSKIDLKSVLNTNLFSMEEARASAGWLSELLSPDYVHVPESIEYNITSFVYRSDFPFHPKKLISWISRYFILESERHVLLASVKDTLNTTKLAEDGANRKSVMIKEVGNVLRSKGFLWIASSNDNIFEWGHGGRMVSLSASEKWFCSKPEAEWGFDSVEDQATIKMKAPYGDRKNEIVFIGQGLNQAAITASLNECLLDATAFEEYNKTLLTSSIGDLADKAESFELTVDTKEPKDIVIPANYALELTQVKFKTAQFAALVSPVEVILLDEDDEDQQDKTETTSLFQYAAGMLRPGVCESLPLQLRVVANGKAATLKAGAFPLYELEDDNSSSEKWTPKVEVVLSGYLVPTTTNSKTGDEDVSSLSHAALNTDRVDSLNASVAQMKAWRDNVAVKIDLGDDDDEDGEWSVPVDAVNSFKELIHSNDTLSAMPPSDLLSAYVKASFTEKMMENSELTTKEVTWLKAASVALFFMTAQSAIIEAFEWQAATSTTGFQYRFNDVIGYLCDAGAISSQAVSEWSLDWYTHLVRDTSDVSGKSSSLVSNNFRDMLKRSAAPLISYWDTSSGEDVEVEFESDDEEDDEEMGEEQDDVDMKLSSVRAGAITSGADLD